MRRLATPWLVCLALPALAAEAPAPELRTAPGHPMRYWVARPPGWAAGRRYPVLVAVTDAAKQWEQTLRDYARARDAGSSPFLVVVPLAVTNGPGDVSRIREAYPYDAATWERVAREGRCRFDLDGLQAVLRDVAARDGGEPRAWLTGLEAGAHTVFLAAFAHPEWLRAAAVISGNWVGRCFRQEPAVAFSRAPERVSLPLRTWDVEGDPQVFLEQQAQALAEAREHGFGGTSVAPSRLPSRAAAPAAVVEWFAWLSGPPGPQAGARLRRLPARPWPRLGSATPSGPPARRATAPAGSSTGSGDPGKPRGSRETSSMQPAAPAASAAAAQTASCSGPHPR